MEAMPRKNKIHTIPKLKRDHWKDTSNWRRVIRLINPPRTREKPDQRYTSFPKWNLIIRLDQPMVWYIINSSRLSRIIALIASVILISMRTTVVTRTKICKYKVSSTTKAPRVDSLASSKD